MQLYQHSGRCGSLGVPMAAAAGILAGLLLGLIYAYVINWIPLIYISFFATAGFGFGVGAAVVWGAKFGKMRNMAIATLTAGVVGVVATYFAWVFDPMARIPVVDQPIWQLESLWEYMKLGYAKGFWSIGHGGGGAVTGPLLAAVWIAEAAIVIGVACYTVIHFLGSQPFCEETNQWTKTETGVARLSLIDDADAPAKTQQLLGGDINALGLFYRAATSDGALLQLDLSACPECATCNYLTVKMVQHVVNRKGQVEKKEDKLLVNWQVPLEDVERIRAAGVERPLEPAPSEPSEDASAEVANET